MKIYKFIKRNNLSIYIRNKLNIKPTVNWDILDNYLYSSVSDSFLWRTDKNFKTIFKFTDILKCFYKMDHTIINIIFFDKKNNYLKKIKLNDLENSNEILINKDFFGGLEDYGTFNIFHENAVKDINVILNNRCYLGFTKDNNFFSYVHGNSLTTSKSDGKIVKDFYKNSFFPNISYKVQNNISKFDKTEVIICNPTSGNIVVYLEKERYDFSANELKILEIKKAKLIELKSNCHVLRPLVFNYKSNFFDVYHG